MTNSDRAGGEFPHRLPTAEPRPFDTVADPDRFKISAGNLAPDTVPAGNDNVIARDIFGFTRTARRLCAAAWARFNRGGGTQPPQRSKNPWETVMNVSVNRRLLASATAASAAIAATPALAKPLAVEEGGDEELVRLGATFDRLCAKAIEIAREFDRVEDAASDQAHGAMNGAILRGDMEAFWQLRRDTGIEQAATASIDAFTAADKVGSEILAMPAQTLAGLAVKSRVVLFQVAAAESYGMPLDEMDYDDRVMHQLAAEIGQLAGAPSMLPGDKTGSGSVRAPTPALGALIERYEYVRGRLCRALDQQSNREGSAGRLFSQIEIENGDPDGIVYAKREADRYNDMANELFDAILDYRPRTMGEARQRNAFILAQLDQDDRMTEAENLRRYLASAA